MSNPDISPKSPSLDDRIQYYILALLKLSVVAAIFLAFYYGQWGALGFSVITLLLMYLPLLIKSHVKVSLPIEFDVVLVIFVYAAVFLGKAGLAYNHFWWWDVVLHTSSGFIIGYVAFLILFVKVRQGKIQASRLLIGLIIFSVALAFGAVWEIFEYGLAVIFGGNLTAAGLKDTIQDLIVDGLGGLVMAKIGIGQIFDHKKGFIARWTHNFIQANPHLHKAKHG